MGALARRCYNAAAEAPTARQTAVESACAMPQHAALIRRLKFAGDASRSVFFYAFEAAYTSRH